MCSQFAHNSKLYHNGSIGHKLATGTFLSPFGILPHGVPAQYPCRSLDFCRKLGGPDKMRAQVNSDIMVSDSFSNHGMGYLKRTLEII